MAPEVAKGLTDIWQAFVSSAVMMISAAAAYGVWKLRQIQQDKKAMLEDARDKASVVYLNDVVGSAVAYVTQTMGLGNMHPLPAGTKLDAMRLAVNKTHEQLPEALRARLVEIYGSLAALNTYIEFRAESEVGRQQVCNIALTSR